MKTISAYLLWCLLLIRPVSHAIAQNIPSAGFENWETRTRQTLKHYTAVGLSSRSSEYWTGTAAVKLENKRSGDGSYQAGIVTNARLGVQSLTGGEAYDEAPLSMRFYAKYNLAPGDKAVLIAAFMLNTGMIGMASIELEGSTDTFTRFSVPVDWQLSAIPDTVAIIISSKDLDTDSIAGDGYLIVDDLHFATLSQRNKALKNGDFELWDTIERHVPQGWFTVDDFVELMGNYLPEPLAMRSNEAHQGSWSLKLMNRRTDQQILPGVAVTGDDPNDAEKPAFPVDRNWKYLEGWYRYMPQNGDSLTILVAMFKQGIPIGMTELVRGNTENAWTYLSVPVQYFSNLVVADSGLLLVGAANFDMPLGDSSTLYIDDLRFTDQTASLTDQELEAIALYPNPARDFITVTGTSSTQKLAYSISDLSGRLIQKDIIIGAERIYFLGNPAPGTYIITLFGENSRVSKTIIIE